MCLSRFYLAEAIIIARNVDNFHACAGWAGNLELATCVHPEVAYFRTVLTLCGLGGVVIATPAVAAMSQGVFEASMWMLVGVVAVRMIWISCRALNLSQTSSAAAVASFLGNGAIHESSLVV
eukprot:SAG31_NODE_1_length_62978_cov_30.836130_2_plen_122_part_00